MICYNFPERGPFEYDKFVLSILEYVNEMNRLKGDFYKDDNTVLCEWRFEVNRILNESLEHSKARACTLMLDAIN